MIRAVSAPESGNGTQGQSPAFEELMSLLRDPHRHEVAAMWTQVAQGKLGPEDRRKAEAMSPIVKQYLSRQIEREEYERQLAAAAVPSVSDFSS
jgi:hypothetical protein